ncbi:hypothetical protein ACHAXS_010930 [Conticribra weissflogii]
MAIPSPQLLPMSNDIQSTSSRKNSILIRGAILIVLLVSSVPLYVSVFIVEISVFDDNQEGPPFLPLSRGNYSADSNDSLYANDHYHTSTIQPTEFHKAAINPVPTYTPELARKAIQSASWKCTSSTHQRPIHPSNHTLFSFVHIYKTAGTTMRQFFHEYSYTCHKTWMSLARCTNTDDSIQKGSKWKGCVIEEVADGRRGFKEHVMPNNKNWVRPGERRYMKINNRVMSERVDVFGGHIRIGSGDWIFHSDSSLNNNSTRIQNLTIPPAERVRYIVFLRDPMERYVSGHLYQNKVNNKGQTLEQIIDRIKKSLVDSALSQSYFTKSFSYLLTPSQEMASKRLDKYRLMEETMRLLPRDETNQLELQSSSTFLAETKTKMVIRNLVHYNAIIGMTERMTESMAILKHVLMRNPEESVREAVEGVFRKFTPELGTETVGNNVTALNLSQTNESESPKGYKANVSKGGLTTSAVMEELSKDKETMELFREFVKYEQLLVDYAWKMHQLQYEAALDFLSTSYT